MPAAPDALTTDRLVLTRVSPSDRDFLARLWADPRVAATLGGAPDDAAVDARIARLFGRWAEVGFGTWVLRTPAGPVGYCGLAPTAVGGPGGVELLYAQLPDAWGNGYVTEAARAILAVAFDPVAGLGLPEVVAFTLPHNTGSRALMERLGFAYVGEVEHAGLAHVLYRLAASTHPAPAP